MHSSEVVVMPSWAAMTRCTKLDPPRGRANRKTGTIGRRADHRLVVSVGWALGRSAARAGRMSRSPWNFVTAIL
jgi:hypothetical protein